MPCPGQIPEPGRVGRVGPSRARRRAAWSAGSRLLIGLAWLAAGSGAVARGGADDEGQVREQVETYWRGFRNVQLEATEVYDDGNQNTERREIRFAWDADGRSALFVTYGKSDRPNSTIRSDMRQDHTRAYRVTYFDAPTPAIDQVSVQPPGNGPGDYRGERFLGLWGLFPGGKTPAKLLADGASLHRAGPLAAHPWSVTGEAQGTRFDCTLDERHAYLPVAVTYTSEGSDGRIEVDEFDRQGAFWFPKRGHGTLTTRLPAGTFASTHEFTLDQVRFNEAIPAARFEMPALAAGVQVSDRTKESTTVEGGKLARQRLKERFPAPKRRKPEAPTIVVPPEVGQAGSWLPPTLIAIGLLSALLAFRLMLRRG